MEETSHFAVHLETHLMLHGPNLAGVPWAPHLRGRGGGGLLDKPKDTNCLIELALHPSMSDVYES